MKVNLAHLRDQGIDFVVFDADAATHVDSDREALLADLTWRARRSGLKVDKSALAFASGRQLRFFGTPDLVQYLSRRGIPRWTHTIDAN